MPTDQYYVCRVLCSKQCRVVSLLRRIEGRIYTTAREEAQGNLQFSQLLYPPNMIKAAKVVISHENIF